MTTKALRPLIIIIVVLAALIYFGGILWAGAANVVSSSPHIPVAVTNIVTGIGSLLATYFGSVLGISIPSETANTNDLTQRPRPAFHFLLFNTWNWNTFSSSETALAHLSAEFFQFIQVGSCYAYFLSLVLAGIFWLIPTIKGTIPIDLLQNMVAMLFGVIIGVLSAALNVHQTA